MDYPCKKSHSVSFGHSPGSESVLDDEEKGSLEAANVSPGDEFFGAVNKP